MSKKDWPEERKRFMEAVEREIAAQRKVRECLKDRSPGHALVISLMDALYEKRIATSEVFNASLADISAQMKRGKPRGNQPPANT